VEGKEGLVSIGSVINGKRRKSKRTRSLGKRIIQDAMQDLAKERQKTKEESGDKVPKGEDGESSGEEENREEESE
jgi:hypothetical protein